MGRYLESLNNGNISSGLALKNLKAYDEDIKKRKENLNKNKQKAITTPFASAVPKKIEPAGKTILNTKKTTEPKNTYNSIETKLDPQKNIQQQMLTTAKEKETKSSSKTLKTFEPAGKKIINDGIKTEKPSMQFQANTSYEYYKSRHKELGDELKKFEFNDTIRNQWAENYRNNPSWTDNPDMLKASKEAFDYVQRRDAVKKEYDEIAEKLKGFTKEGVHKDNLGNVDTKSGIEEAKLEREIGLNKQKGAMTHTDVFTKNNPENATPEEIEHFNELKPYIDDVALASDKIEAYEYYDKNKDKTYGDNIFGRFFGNAKLGRIGIKSNDAGFTLYSAQSDDFETDDIYKLLSEKIQKNSAKTFVNDSALDNIIATIGQYAPQGIDQLKRQTAGQLIGNLTTLPGMGTVVSSALVAQYMYEQTAGASYINALRNEKLTIEEARELAQSEAQLSALIEFGLEALGGAAIDAIKLGKGVAKEGVEKAGAKLISSLIGENAEKVTKAGTKEIVEALVKSGMKETTAKKALNAAKNVGKFAFASATEGAEEWLQEAISISADRMSKQGKTGSMLDVLKESFNFEAYSDDDLKRMNQSFLGGVIIGTGQSAAHLGFNASWNTAVNKLSKAADAKTMGNLIIENPQSDSIVRKTFEYAMKTDNSKIKNEANLLLSEFQANGKSFNNVKNVEKRLGNIALGLTQEGQNVFSQNSVFNPHAKIDNLTQRILNGKDVTNQELMLYNQTKNKNRFKVLTGIDLTGNPVEVRNQLNSMIKEGKSKSAVVDVVNKIVQGEEITGTDIDSLVEHKDYLAKASQIEIEGNTDAEIRNSIEGIVSKLKERAAVRNGVNNDSMVRYSVANIKGENTDYGTGVVLDTDIFDGIKPRDWNKKLSGFVYDNLAGNEMTVYDENGNPETISFAKKNERVTKEGAENSHRVIDKLARTKGNVNMLAVVHIDELLHTAAYYDNNAEHNHQWLDENGWEHRKTYLQTRNGDIYETTLNIAKSKDGRKILYALSNTKRVEAGAVPSSVNGRGSHTSINSDNRVSQNNPVVNNSMQNNSDNTSNTKENYGTQLTEENINNLSGQNKKGFKRMIEELDVYVNPDADRASYIPGRNGEKDKIIVRSEEDAIHEAGHALKRYLRSMRNAVSKGEVSSSAYEKAEKMYNDIRNELINSDFYFEKVIGNEEFKERLFGNKETAEGITSFEGFTEALYDLYADTYRAEYLKENNNMTDEEIETAVRADIDEEAVSFGLQQLSEIEPFTLNRMMQKDNILKKLVTKIKDFWNYIVNTFKGSSSYLNSELKYARKMADKFNKLFNEVASFKGDDSGNIKFSIMFNEKIGKVAFLDGKRIPRDKGEKLNHAIRRFFDENFKGHQIIAEESNDNVVLDQIGKYLYSGEIVDKYNEKRQIVSVLDELVEIAVNKQWRENLYDKNGNVKKHGGFDCSNGFNYYETQFAVDDSGVIWGGTVIARIDKNDNVYFYDLDNIREVGYQDVNSFNPVIKSSSTSPNNKIPQKKPVVKNNLMQKNGNNAEISKNNIMTASSKDKKLSFSETVARNQSEAKNVTTPNSTTTRENVYAPIELVGKLKNSIPDLKNMKYVKELTGNEFDDRKKKLSEQVADFFKSLGGIVSRNNFGSVILDMEGIKSSIAHGIGRAKAITFSAVPEVIKYGTQIDYQPNWKGRGYDTYVFAAPVKIGGKDTFVGAVVTKDKNNKYYLHEVLDENGNIIKIGDGASIKTASISNNEMIGEASSPSNNKVSQNDPVVNNSMQNNSDNTLNAKENKGTRLTINNIRSFGFKNQKALERLAEEYKLYYNPEAAEAEYNPEDNSITIRNEADAIHEAAHALKNSMNALREFAKANPEYNGKYKRTLRQYNNLKNELIHSSFFTEYVVLNQQFKESLFDKETAENIGTAEEFREALSSLYEYEYKGNPEAVEEELLSYGLQQLESLNENTLDRMMNNDSGFKGVVNKIKEFFRSLSNVFKGNSNTELRYAERMADNFNKLYNKLEEIKSKTKGVRFSKEYTFNKQVDDALGNRIQRGYSVYVGKLPNLLAKCGLDPELPMLMQPSHIRDINHERDINNRHWHGIDKELIKQIPKMLKNPVMIYDSISEINKENSVCILTSECDSKGDPIIIVLTNSEQSNKYLDVKLEVVKTNASNHIDTMYGREGFRYHIKDIVDANAVLYVSKDGIEKLLNNKNLRLNSDGKLELLARLDNLRFDTIIHKSNNIVNTKSMQNSKNNAEKFTGVNNQSEDIKSENEGIRFSKQELSELSVVDKKFKAMLEEYKKGKKSGYVFDLGSSPKWINNSPLGNKRIDVAPNIIEKAEEKHNIPVENLENLVYEIQNPVMAFPSISENVKEGTQNIVVLTNIKNAEGFPVVCAITLDATNYKIKVDRVTSIQRKDNITSFLKRSIEAANKRENYINGKKLLCVDKEKTIEWLDAIGLQLPKLNNLIQLLNDSIPHLNISVNNYSMNNTEKILQDDGKRKSKQTLTPQTDEEISEQYDELNKKYGSIKKGEKWERDVSVPKRTEKRKYVSRFARTMAESDIFPEENMSEFERLVVSGKMSHEQLSDKKVEESTIRLIKEEGYEAALQHFLLSARQGIVKKDVIALGQQLLNQAYTAKDVETAMQLSSELAILATEAGRSVQAQRMLKKLSPDGQLYYLEKTIQKINRELESKNIKDANGNIAVVRMNEEKAEKLFKAKSQQEIDEAVAEITTDIAHQMPVTFSDKWNAWRYMAMLANPKTHIRNMLGNAFFVPMSAAKNIIGATMENVMLSPEQRTKAYKMDEKVREFAEKDFENVLDILKGEAKYTGDTKIEREKIVFKTKALEAIRQKNSDFLDAEDAIFLKYHYTRALARIMTARGITAKQLEFDSKGTNSLLEKIREVAIEEAQRNTFRDTNAVANYISRTQSKLRKHALGKPVAGVIEGILPFKNTPLNIAKQGWYYSPGGLIQGIAEYVNYVKGGEVSAAQAIDHMASGLTGMAVAALGGLLLQLGFLTKLPDDDKEKTLGKLMGTQNYALQIGSVSYSIDWVAPAIMPLAIGASLVESLRDTNASPITAMINAFNKMTEPVFELSCLQGVSSMLETVAFYEGAAPLVMAGEALLSYTGQAIPTISGQLARTVDKTQRQTVADENSFLPDKLQYFIQNQAKKIPGASRFVTPKIDAWGNEMTYADNAVVRTVEQFFSPGYIDTKENDAVNDELKRLNISTGHTSHIPGNAKKSVEADGKTNYFNKTEYLLYNKIKGQTSKEILDVMINLPEYKTLTDEQKVEVISEYAYKYSAALAKVKTIKGEKFQTQYYSEDYSRWSITKIAKDMIERKISSDKKKEND